MPRYESIRDRLPSLYRPDPDDNGLLPQFLKAIASVLDEINALSGEVMQAHWFDHADSALYSSFLLRNRLLEGKLPISPLKAEDRKLLDEFPYIHDLAWLADLIPLPPWQEPPAYRESVEAYRARIRRMVELYKNGLGTPSAFRRVVEAQFPINMDLPADQRDRPFTIEEFAPLVYRLQQVKMAPGAEFEDMAGPLMTWKILNDGLETGPPTVYIQGVAAVPDKVDETAKPLIERVTPLSNGAHPAIGYDDTIPPDKTIRLRPGYRSWLGMAKGVQLAESLPDDNGPGNPTADGPWSKAKGGPADPVTAFLITPDNVLWVSINAATGELHRFDGTNWTVALTGLDTVNCLCEEGQNILVGTDKGVARLAQYPPDGQPFTGVAVPGIDASPVRVLFRDSSGVLQMGSDKGASILVPDPNSPGAYIAQPTVLAGFPVFAISQDWTGALYYGGTAGLFQFQPDLNAWYVYSGGDRTEQASDWKPFAAGPAPADKDIFLPTVRSVYRGPDASLWIGTDNGLARYVARQVDGFAFDTYLEAFPDLSPDTVRSITQDARGRVWFCTDRGLFRFDGRDIEHFEDKAWVSLGRADTIYDPNAPVRDRDAWRFVRGSSQWQRFDTISSSWVSWTTPPRTPAQPAVTTICWSDTVVADLGDWDGNEFSNGKPVAVKKIVSRVKPDPTRIVNGGMPAVPRIPAGESKWRYLSREPDVLPEIRDEDKPAFTIEGRLLPPPPDGETEVGRFDQHTFLDQAFDDELFAFNPAARVWISWDEKRPLSVLTHIPRAQPDESIDPVVLDRLWQGIETVRPAGVRALLAVDEEIVRPKK